MIGKVAVRNRTVLAPMVTGMANYDGTPSEQLVDYYEERAKNGLGLLITGATRVNTIHGATLPRQTSMAYDRHIAPFAAMVDRVHAHGTRVFCQLHHPGRQGISLMTLSAPSIELMGRLWPGMYGVLPKLFGLMAKSPIDGDQMARLVRWPAVVAPSTVPCELYDQRTRSLKRWEIRNLEKQFIRAARRVQLAGADGVELHAAHGYLIEQFMSTQSNKRKDEYGGILENRMRFVLNMISGIRSECGPDFPISVRLSVDEFYRCIGKPHQGIELEEGVEMARRLEGAGIDAINVSSATYDTMNYWMEPMSFEEGWRKYLARAVREAVSIPVIAANLVRSPEQAEAEIADGTQDLVALGRPFLADPAWVAKAMEGREDEIRRCISCLRCIESLPENGQIGLPLECAVNPRLGRERETGEPRRDGGGRTVVVLGAGPSGLAAAEVLAGRGFKTVVLERSGTAGGQLNLANKAPGKDKVNWCVVDLEAAARRNGADIRFGSEPSISEIKDLDPFAVIVATGARPRVPDMPGTNRENVCTVNEVLEGTVALSGKRVAVIGSGLTGLETAEKLAADGNSMVVVEMMDELGPGAYFQNLEDVLGRLVAYNPELITSHRLVEIGEGEVVLEHVRSGRRVTRPVDQVVLAVGVRGEERVAAELQPHFARVITVGDAREPGRIYGAVRGGFDAAWDL